MQPATQRETELLVELGELVRKVRIAHSEYQADFAHRIGISVPTYRKMEQGHGSVPIGYWIRALILLDQREIINRLMTSLEDYVKLQVMEADQPLRQRVRK